MKNYQFKTDIHCKSCISKIESFLQKKQEIKTWKIDLDTKILKIEGEISDIQDFENAIFEQTQVYVEEIQ